MQFPPTVIFRHRKENLKKCSLKGLEQRADFCFYKYPITTLPDLDDTILLTLDAPPLTENDASHGLLILDATWRLSEKMLKRVEGESGIIRRSIPPHYKTAYLRKQDDCPNPEQGLASIEAIYIAYKILGRNTDGLLNYYYWKLPFLALNKMYWPSTVDSSILLNS